MNRDTAKEIAIELFETFFPGIVVDKCHYVQIERLPPLRSTEVLVILEELVTELGPRFNLTTKEQWRPHYRGIQENMHVIAKMSGGNHGR